MAGVWRLYKCRAGAVAGLAGACPISIVPSAPSPTPVLVQGRATRSARGLRCLACYRRQPQIRCPAAAADQRRDSLGCTTKRASKASSPEDLGLLLDAMRALRVERNPARARALLTAYLDRHPKGELSEEALVMLVEAAVAHHDGDASALVARYHKLYPRGVFRGLVEQSATSKGRSQIAMRAAACAKMQGCT